MKNKAFALPLLALLMVCFAAIFASCDLFDSDNDTVIKIKNDSVSKSGDTWCITEIDIKDDMNKPVYFVKNLRMFPGGDHRISVDEGGTYRFKLTAAKAYNGSRQAYGSHSVPNNGTLTVSFDGSNDLDFD